MSAQSMWPLCPLTPPSSRTKCAAGTAMVSVTVSVCGGRRLVLLGHKIWITAVLWLHVLALKSSTQSTIKASTDLSLVRVLRCWCLQVQKMAAAGVRLPAYVGNLSNPATAQPQYH